MDSNELRKRTKRFAINAIKLAERLPKSVTGRIVAGQFIKASSSVAANYRAVCRARSRAEFNSKLHIVLEEADESVFWLEIIIGTELLPPGKINPLIGEANQLTAIFARSLFTSKQNQK